LAFNIAAASCCAIRSSFETLRCLTLADQHRRQRGREDEARRVAANAVDDGLVGRDIAAHYAEGLAQRALDDGDTVGHGVTLGNTAAAWSIHPDRMDLVEIGQRIIFICEIADRGDRRDVAVHGIDALERDQLRRGGIFGG
jgi:hypothetical protein